MRRAPTEDWLHSATWVVLDVKGTSRVNVDERRLRHYLSCLQDRRVCVRVYLTFQGRELSPDIIDHCEADIQNRYNFWNRSTFYIIVYIRLEAHLNRKIL